MADIVAPDVRSRMMARIRSKNTKPELLLRRALHAKGVRYRLHKRGIPGRPDIWFGRYNAAIFVNGCFWHGHDCNRFRLPQTRRDFWEDKISTNRTRDMKTRIRLDEAGIRHRTIWECELAGEAGLAFAGIVDECIEWLVSGSGV